MRQADIINDYFIRHTIIIDSFLKKGSISHFVSFYKEHEVHSVTHRGAWTFFN